MFNRLAAVQCPGRVNTSKSMRWDSIVVIDLFAGSCFVLHALRYWVAHSVHCSYLAVIFCPLSAAAVAAHC